MMPVSAETLRKLMAAGLAGETLVDIVASIDRDMELERPTSAPSARPDRNRRYYENHRAEIKAKRLKASDFQSSESVLRRLNSDDDASIQNPARAHVEDNLLPEETPGKKKIDIRLDEAFQTLRSAYPKRQGSDPSEPAKRKLLAILKSGVDLATIVAGASRYAEEQRGLQHVGTPFIKQLSAWLNQHCWQDYQGPNGHDPPSEFHFGDADEYVAKIRADDETRKKTIPGT